LTIIIKVKTATFLTVYRSEHK